MQNEPIAASIEVSPKHALEMADLDLIIPQGVRTYITDIGTHSTADMARGCERLISFGLKAVPHIAARRLADEAELEDKVRGYAAAGVTDVLVIGGGADRLQGEVHSTMQVLETGLFDAHGITEIGVAGHPEGTPDFSDEVAEIALRLKKEFAERTGARMRIVTQFGFDAEKFVNWAEGLSKAGNDLPVHLGVAGPAKTMTLLKYAAMCGVGNSIGFLKKNAGAVTALAASHSPESVVGPIEEHVQSAERTAIRGVHVFPFGGLQNTSRWLSERGSWPVLQQMQAANRA
ncbi:MAG: methylenetetrahydrofolate reductase [Rhizobiaceae bacterium]